MALGPSGSPCACVPAGQGKGGAGLCEEAGMLPPLYLRRCVGGEVAFILPFGSEVSTRSGASGEVRWSWKRWAHAHPSPGRRLGALLHLLSQKPPLSEAFALLVTDCSFSILLLLSSATPSPSCCSLKGGFSPPHLFSWSPLSLAMWFGKAAFSSSSCLTRSPSPCFVARKQLKPCPPKLLSLYRKV